MSDRQSDRCSFARCRRSDIVVLLPGLEGRPVGVCSVHYAARPDAGDTAESCEAEDRWYLEAGVVAPERRDWPPAHRAPPGAER